MTCEEVVFAMLESHEAHWSMSILRPAWALQVLYV